MIKRISSIKNLVLRFEVIILLMVIALFPIYTKASTPLEGPRWAGNNIGFYNDGTNSYYQNIWNTAASNWSSASSIITVTDTGGEDDFRVGNKYDSSVTWDGITYYSSDSYNTFFTKVRCYVNTYYTTQDKYTTSIINGITTHELGHGLGLGHNNSTSSVMYPYTFNSDGSLARIHNTPQSDDISAINKLYMLIANNNKSRIDSSKEQHIILDPSWAIKYKDIKDMAKDSDLIVEGEITKELGTKYPFKGDYLNYHMEANLKVNKILKGVNSATIKNIVIGQLGGYDDQTQVISNNVTPLKNGDRVILFLKKGSDNIYYPINENDGIFAKVNLSDTYINLSLYNSFEINKNELLNKIDNN